MNWGIDLLIALIAFTVVLVTGIVWLIFNRIHKTRYRDFTDSIAWSIPHRVVALVNFFAWWVAVVFGVVGLVLLAVS